MLIEFTENPLVNAGFWTARITAVKVIGKFLWLFLWPAKLSADYSYNAVPLFDWRASSWEDAKALISVAICLGSVLLAARWRHTVKPFLFFLGFFFVALLPTSNLVITIGSIMAERFLYLAAVGLAGCTVAAIRQLALRFSSKWRIAPQAAWVAMECSMSGLRGAHLRPQFRLAECAYSLDHHRECGYCPESARPHYNAWLLSLHKYKESCRMPLPSLKPRCALDSFRLRRSARITTWATHSRYRLAVRRTQ